MFNIYGIFDKVSCLYKHIFMSQESQSDAKRSFIGAMYGQNDIALFNDDFELYFLGSVDLNGEITVNEKHVLLITGTKAKKFASSNLNLKEAFGSLDEEANNEE